MKENIGTPASVMSTNNFQQDSPIQPKALLYFLPFMKKITKEEQNTINVEIYADNDGNNMSTICDYTIVCSRHFSTLRPQVWLNDEIIHYFYCKLNIRDI